MKLLRSLAVAAACLSACNSSSEQNTAKIDTAPLIETLCFQRTEGLQKQDTSYVQLVINGGQITGVFAHMPYEKDSRIGTILGTMEDRNIKGKWIYMQEGIQDTLDIEFKLDSEKLLQKNYSVDVKTGRQFLSDSSEFKIEYSSIDCSALPARLQPR